MHSFCTASSFELMSTKLFAPMFLKSVSFNLDTIFSLSKLPIWTPNSVHLCIIIPECTVIKQSELLQNKQSIMPIVQIWDFCIIVTILGNKTSTILLKFGCIINQCLIQYNLTIQVAKTVPKLHFFTQIQTLFTQTS